MDADRFDGLVRSFGQARSRRQTLRGLVGAVAAGALALGGQEADAATRIGGSPCTRGRQCKTGRCVGTPGHKTCSCSKKYPRCTSGGTCQTGTCTACLALKADCTDANQCCRGLACAPIGQLNQDQCCRPLGGACSTPNQFDECCSVVFAPGSGTLVYCAPNNTCGGPGARCTVPATCASGVCCGFGLDGVCCAAGQQCVSQQCVG